MRALRNAVVNSRRPLTSITAANNDLVDENVGTQIFAMALDSAELEATRQMAILNRVKYIRGGVLIVALVRPPRNVEMPKLSPEFPAKALMNLVSDLCESR